MTWCQRQRIEWIQMALRVFGFVNRDHICRMFDTSISQATLDLRMFSELYPDAMIYDTGRKIYVAKDGPLALRRLDELVPEEEE